MDEISRDENLDDESYQIREVYAQYGLTMYLAQVVELQVANAAMMSSVAPGSYPSEEDYQAAWDEHFTVTLGRLVKRLRPHVADDEKFVQDLEKALRLRNHLTHHFFRTQAGDFMSTSGRESMLVELLEAREFFDEFKERMSPVVFRFMTQAGFDPAEVDRYAREETDRWREPLR